MGCRNSTNLERYKVITGMLKLFHMVTIKSNGSDSNNKKQMQRGKEILLRFDPGSCFIAGIPDVYI